MFERIKMLFRKGGAVLNTGETLSKVTDHPRISMPEAEYNRIIRNKQFYMQKFDPIEYLDSNGDLCY